MAKPEGKANRLGGLDREHRASVCRVSPSLKPCATMCASRQKNYAIDMGPFPLGSCTMKHNPRLNEKMARLPGFVDLHPLDAGKHQAQGALELIDTLAFWLKELTGHARSRHVAEGRRSWRALRHDGDQGGD